MFGLGMPELLLVLVVALVLFGPKRLPEFGRSLGKSIAAFKKGLKESIDEDGETPPTKPPAIKP
jgi:sec-independent protein translocase protein TatA